MGRQAVREHAQARLRCACRHIPGVRCLKGDPIRLCGKNMQKGLSKSGNANTIDTEQVYLYTSVIDEWNAWNGVCLIVE